MTNRIPTDLPGFEPIEEPDLPEEIQAILNNTRRPPDSVRSGYAPPDPSTYGAPLPINGGRPTFASPTTGTAGAAPGASGIPSNAPPAASSGAARMRSNVDQDRRPSIATVGRALAATLALAGLGGAAYVYGVRPRALGANVLPSAPSAREGSAYHVARMLYRAELDAKSAHNFPRAAALGHALDSVAVVAVKHTTPATQIQLASVGYAHARAEGEASEAARYALFLHSVPGTKESPLGMTVLRDAARVNHSYGYLSTLPATKSLRGVTESTPMPLQDAQVLLVAVGQLARTARNDGPEAEGFREGLALIAEGVARGGFGEQVTTAAHLAIADLSRASGFTDGATFPSVAALAAGHPDRGTVHDPSVVLPGQPGPAAGVPATNKVSMRAGGKRHR